jgi:hypothetical protein
MCRVVAKFVNKLLSQEQKQLHLEITQDMLECANEDPEFLKTVITGDETSRPKKAQRVRSKVKVLLTVSFDYCGIVHHSYAPEGQTINKEYYLEVIRHLCDAVQCKRPDLRASCNWQ